MADRQKPGRAALGDLRDHAVAVRPEEADAGALVPRALVARAFGEGAGQAVGLKKGADDYLTKPFNLEELLLRVEKLIEKNKKIIMEFSNLVQMISHYHRYMLYR